MASLRSLATGLLLAVPALLPAAALEIERSLVEVRYVRPPLVPTAKLDYAGLRAEVAFGEIRIGEPTLRRVAGSCPGSSAEAEREVYYYEVRVEASRGVLVVHDGAGVPVHAAPIERLATVERFGLENCRHGSVESLSAAFERERPDWLDRLRARAGRYYLQTAERLVDRAMFAEVRTEQVPCNRFHDPAHDYGDLVEAADRALSGYRSIHRGEPAEGRLRLLEAVERWEAALEGEPPGDPAPRITQQVAAGLHENIGAAMLVLGAYDDAIRHLEQAARLEQPVRRPDGSGGGDLLLRARTRRIRSARLDGDGLQIEALLEQSRNHRGRVPLTLVPDGLARLQADYGRLVDAQASGSGTPKSNVAVSPGRNGMRRTSQR